MTSTIFGCTTFLVILISLDIRSFAKENYEGLVSQSSYAMSSKLYNELAKKDSKNILISPLSMNYALAALSIGTERRSFEELTNAMSLPNNPDTVKTAYKDLTHILKNENNLTIATKLFIDNEFKVKERYQEDIAEYFSSDVGRTDFKNDNDGARQEMNNWVEAHTNKRIKNMFPKGSISSSTEAVLINAVHFKSDWAHPFDKRLTQPETFYGLDGQFEAEMMKNTAPFQYKCDTTLRADIISLPYKSDFTMLLLVPHNRYGIKDLEKKLARTISNSNSLSSSDMLMRRLRLRLIELTMPKFTLEVTYYMKHILKQIGVRNIFTSGDLTKISDEKIIIDDVIQKTYLNVDEVSTEAAAATAVNFVSSTAPGALPPRPFELKVDHPFIFQIVERKTKLCVFSGRFVTDKK